MTLDCLGGQREGAGGSESEKQVWWWKPRSEGCGATEPGCRGPPEAGKGREMDSSLEPLEGTQHG